MKAWLKKINFTGHTALADYGYLLVRVCFGLLLLKHGYPKVANFTEYAQHFSDPIGLGSHTSLLLAIFAEFICAICIVLGLFTRLASIPLVINFLVIFFIVHGSDPLGKKELVAAYLMLSLGTLLMGAGKISIDRKMGF